MRKNKEFCDNGEHVWVSDDSIVYCNQCKSLQEFVKGFPKKLNIEEI